MAEDRPVQIYVDGHRIAGAIYGPNGLRDRVHGLSSATREPSKRARDCTHDRTADGYAYVDLWNLHWPIRYCRDCYTVLAGRRPSIAPSEPAPAWSLTVEDVVAAKWASEWPRDGRPRRKRTPPESEWPDGY